MIFRFVQLAFHRLVLASALVVLAAGAAKTDGTPPYLNLIGVGCVPWKADGTSLTWHPELEGIPPTESWRVFKHFEGEDTKRCLALIIDDDKGLAKRAHALCSKTAPHSFEKTLAGIHRRWTEFGVADALEEVAKTGERGPKTEALLSKCEALERAR